MSEAGAEAAARERGRSTTIAGSCQGRFVIGASRPAVPAPVPTRGSHTFGHIPRTLPGGAPGCYTGRVATYAIGDVQGCFEPFMQLLERVRFDPGHDRLWLVGDLVNRGPRSLDVLRWLHAHDRCVTAVLGNHDVYALARAFDAVPPTHDDTLGELLAAPDRDALITWLAARPVLHQSEGHVLVHAGLLPAWDLPAAHAEARAIEAALGADPRAFLAAYFHRPRRPWSWSPLSDVERAVAALSVMTRLRFVDAEGAPAPGAAPPESPPAPETVPWFRAAGRRSRGTPIVFGHWAALGLWIEGDVLALDSGCVWGGSLAAVRLEDRAVFAVPARRDGD